MFNLVLNQIENQLLLPDFTPNDLSSLKEKLIEYEISNHFVISSSGTTGGKWKGYVISQDSLQNNARAVNKKLNLDSSDIWGASLPYYHIGGLAIYFRAALLGHVPVNLRPWSVQNFSEKIELNNITAISLVPTQVYDLVEQNISVPKNLKVVLVGGDFLSRALETRFKDLGWPLTKTFGMTEVCSQLCTGVNEKGLYQPLSIHNIKSDDQKNLYVRSQSFFSYLVNKNKDWMITPLHSLLDDQGYLKLSDKIDLLEDGIRVLGREDGLIKSSGHLVNFLELRELLEKFTLNNHCWGEIEIQCINSPRKGQEIVLHCLETVPKETTDAIIKLMAPIKISSIVNHKFLSRTKLGKFKAN